MASRSVPGESAAHRSRPGSEEAWADSRAVIFPHSSADKAASQGDAYNVSRPPFSGTLFPGGTFLAVGDTPCYIDEKTRSVPPHGKECPPPQG